MKTVMISIRPKWVEKILNGEKTVEVRKTKPSCDLPFKCLIYCTKGKECIDIGKTLSYTKEVVGEFICDKISEYRHCYVPYRAKNNLGYEKSIDDGVYRNGDSDDGFVFETESKYIDDMMKNSDFEKIGLSPQELADYIKLGKYAYLWHISDLKIYDEPKALEEFGLKRAPQSWCYVEEKENI